MLPVFKAIPEAQVASLKVEDKATPASTFQDMLEICVSYEGQGIPSEQLERIFNRFYRVDNSLIREANGLGLGLAICRHIVELHHGLIRAENKPDGRGSTLRLRLPLSEALAV